MTALRPVERGDEVPCRARERKPGAIAVRRARR
jgi:hypothetical protein